MPNPKNPIQSTRPHGKPKQGAPKTTGQATEAPLLSPGLVQWLVHNASMGLMLWDDAENILFVNESFTGLTGYTAEQVPDLGQWFGLALADPASRMRIAAQWRTAASGDDGPWRMEVACGNGARKTLEVRIAAGEQGQGLATLEDVTPSARAEAALIKDEDWQRLIRENIHESMTVLDATGLMYFANYRAAANLSGDPDADLAGRNVGEFLDPDQFATLKELYALVLEQDRSITQYLFLDMADGRKWLQNTLSPLGPNDDGVRLILSLSLDITERHAADTELRESEQRFKALFEDAPDPIFVADVETRRLVQVNAAAERLLDLDRNQLIGRQIDDLHPARMATSVSQLFDRHLARVALGQPLPPEEVIVLRPDGAEIPVEIHGRATTLSGRACLMGTFRDVSERKKAEAAIKASEERIRCIIENVKMIAIQGYDENRRVIFWNDASRELYGYTQQEALGNKLEDLIIPGPIREGVIQGIQDWIKNGVPIPACELVLRHKDGGEVPVFSSHVMYEDALGRKEMFCIDADLSTVKRMQAELLAAKDAAEAANTAKSRFLANMSHELRTPLSGIMGMLQLLRMSELEEVQRQYADAAHDSGYRLIGILGDILDLAKIEAGKMQLQRAPFSLAELLESVRDTFRLSADQAELELTTRLDPDLPADLDGDGQRLRQILFNLTGNAVKFTPSGSVTISAWSLPAGEPENVRVLFMVEDTGIGMDDATLRSMFDPFNQADTSYSRQYQGAGLGLAIVKRFVDLMHGALCVDSEPNRGSTFYLRLDFQRSKAKRGASQESPRETRPIPGTLKALVVEDEKVNRLALKRLLETMGLMVHDARNGREALDALAKEPFDIVFMDIQMPVMDGLATTRSIRETPEFAHCAGVYIVALTAHAMMGDRESFLDAGMDDYLAKPVDMAGLARVIACAGQGLRRDQSAAAGPHTT